MGQSFDYGEALQICAKVHDRQVNIIESQADDIEGVFATAALGLGFLDQVGKIVPVVTYQNNVSPHEVK